jgi:hypothetical protein
MRRRDLSTTVIAAVFGVPLGLVQWPAPAWGQCQPAWSSEFADDLNGAVYALAVFDDGTGPALYVGGDFTTAGGTPANHIAKWNGTNWAALGSGTSGGFFPGVNALTVFNGQLIAGGGFTSAGGVSAECIAKWNGTGWSPLGSGMEPQNPYDDAAVVYSLAVFEGGLIAGGHFWTAGGVYVRNIARWDGSSWGPFGCPLSYGPYFPDFAAVYGLTVFGSELIAGGHFLMADYQYLPYILRSDGTYCAPLGSGMNADVLALTVYNGELIAGGSFTVAGGVSAIRIARWNGTSWSSLGSGMNGTVYALTVFDGQLIAGGSFTTAGGVPANRIARWDGAGWSPLGDGMNNAVRALTEFDEDGAGINPTMLYAGGSFTTAGGLSSAYFARWGCMPILTGDTNCDGTVDFADINPFVLALSNPTLWYSAFPGCNILSADISGNGSVGFDDINPFVELLTGRPRGR